MGLNQPKPASRTATIAIDFAKAFDSVNHSLQLQKVSDSSLPHNLVRWLAAYLRGRTATCQYLSSTSPRKITRSGVPQGSVISPCLFNFFVSDCPTTPQIITSYADDVTIAEQAPDTSLTGDTVAAQFREALTPILNWASSNKLSIAPSKSSVSFFSPWNKQFRTHPQVIVDDTPIPSDQQPKILGVTFDAMFKFSPHINSIIERSASRRNILKALAGISWWQQKETLRLTYNAMIKPIFTYACPIWFPHTSYSNITRLQSVPNKVLRIISGSVQMSSVDHIQSERILLLWTTSIPSARCSR